MRRRESVWERIEYRYDVTRNGCWNWIGWLRQGYATLTVWAPSGKRTHRNVHVLLWELLNGPVPKGKHLHHTCENRRCINPDHLELVTPKQHFGKHPTMSASLDIGRKLKTKPWKKKKN